MMGRASLPQVLLAYTKGQRLTRKMTAEEIIDWTKSGIPDAVIEAAASSRIAAPRVAARGDHLRPEFTRNSFSVDCPPLQVAAPREEDDSS